MFKLATCTWGSSSSSYILGSLLFLIYVNDVPDGLKSNAKLFADDTSLSSVVKNKENASDPTNDFDTTSKWA